VYRTDEYILQTENEDSMLTLMKGFDKIQKGENNQLSFRENEHSMYEILRFVADKKISLIKFEKAEPTLESLFMEVIKK
jgi:ABC-2 type transport system ATP-binding protein